MSVCLCCCVWGAEKPSGEGYCVAGLVRSLCLRLESHTGQLCLVIAGTRCTDSLSLGSWLCKRVQPLAQALHFTQCLWAGLSCAGRVLWGGAAQSCRGRAAFFGSTGRNNRKFTLRIWKAWKAPVGSELYLPQVWSIGVLRYSYVLVWVCKTKQHM